MQSVKLLLITIVIGISTLAQSQSVPVGLPVLDDYLRRGQLLGDSLTNASLMIRPAYVLKSPEKGFVFKLMPLVWKQQYNTDHPEGFNDGSMIPARGYQTLVSGGFFAKYGILSVQLMPEFVYARNLPFDGLPDALNDKVWKTYYDIKKKIDLPDRFGDDPYRKICWGQSAVRLNYKSLSIGISNENLWWGPGIKNTLLMTNNAPGFKHITFNTIKPVSTPIGTFEWQVIGGKLEPSGYPGVDTTKVKNHNIKLFKKPDDWEYINAMTVNYQPRWLPGLSLGVARSYLLYSKNLTKNYRTWLPLFEPLFKVDVGGEAADTIPSDQIASVWVRWLMPKSHSEIYVEFGREDHNWDFTDFALEPAHYRAFITGFRKVVPLVERKREYLDVQFEMTQMSLNLVSDLRKGSSFGEWYTHGQVLNGYTNLGQIMGAGTGISSDMQSVSLSWVKDYKKIGLEIVRLAHDEDFWSYISQKTGYGDYRTHWVDLSGALVADWDYKNLLINLKVQTIGSINYMFYYDPIPSDPPFWWDHGAIRWNVHGELSLVWRFE